MIISLKVLRVNVIDKKKGEVSSIFFSSSILLSPNLMI